MILNNSFEWISIPGTRRADYHISYADSCVILDFSSNGDSIQLSRISFDGYGCCDISTEPIQPLSHEHTEELRTMFDTGIIDQTKMKYIITSTIRENKKYLWTDALIEYNLLPSHP